MDSLHILYIYSSLPFVHLAYTFWVARWDCPAPTYLHYRAPRLHCAYPYYRYTRCAHLLPAHAALCAPSPPGTAFTACCLHLRCCLPPYYPMPAYHLTLRCAPHLTHTAFISCCTHFYATAVGFDVTPPTLCPFLRSTLDGFVCILDATERPPPLLWTPVLAFPMPVEPLPHCFPIALYPVVAPHIHTRLLPVPHLHLLSVNSCMWDG